VLNFLKARLPGRLLSLIGVTRTVRHEKPMAPPVFQQPEPIPASAISVPPLPAEVPMTANEEPPSETNRIQLQLDSILKMMPPELRQRLVCSMVGSLVSISTDSILPQLARGSVKISFGELRQAAPGVFSAVADMDDVAVTLPLGEIVAQLGPDSLQCRQARSRIEILEDIPGPFGPFNDVAQAADRIPRERKDCSIERHDESRSRKRIATPAKGGNTGTWFEIPTTRTEVSSTAPTAPVAPKPTVRPLRPEKAPINPRAVACELSSVWDGWPAALRSELLQFGLRNSCLILPPEAVEKGMKRGQIAFLWKELREILDPPLTTVSAHDQVKVVLPLEKIAPLFLAKHRKSVKKQEITEDKSIPALFSIPEEQTHNPAERNNETEPTTVAPVAGAAEKPAASSQAVQAPAISPTAGDGKGRSLPDMLVFRATALRGVSGAIVVLPEGLKVASRLNPQFDPELVAAFIPQIFNNTKDAILKLNRGNITRMIFYLEDVPWMLFRTETAILAAIGYADTNLPEKELMALAAELANHV
jgi:predicted regulator of Ras-like GTPase activity (Roadblock/LC7/MglB family)